MMPVPSGEHVSEWMAEACRLRSIPCRIMGDQIVMGIGEKEITGPFEEAWRIRRMMESVRKRKGFEDVFLTGTAVFLLPEETQEALSHMELLYDVKCASQAYGLAVKVPYAIKKDLARRAGKLFYEGKGEEAATCMDGLEPDALMEAILAGRLYMDQWEDPSFLKRKRAEKKNKRILSMEGTSTTEETLALNFCEAPASFALDSEEAKMLARALSGRGIAFSIRKTSGPDILLVPGRAEKDVYRFLYPIRYRIEDGTQLSYDEFLRDAGDDGFIQDFFPSGDGFWERDRKMKEQQIPYTIASDGHTAGAVCVLLPVRFEEALQRNGILNG